MRIRSFLGPGQPSGTQHDPIPSKDVRTLVMGWFSFELYNATAGDIMACEVACEWLKSAGREYDVALAPPFKGGVDWRSVDPNRYSSLLFVCGPLQEREETREFLSRFAHCRKIGLNVTMLNPLDEWNPFDYLIERDSPATAHPDISFIHERTKLPVVGLVLADMPNDPHDRKLDKLARDAFHRLIDAREMSVVTIDTRLDTNSTGLRTAGEVESLIARMDVVLTSRVHGTVLAIKNGVPPVVIDTSLEGAKVRRQAESIAWPVWFNAKTVTDTELQKAFDYCLTEEARLKARQCAARARKEVFALRKQFVAELVKPV